MSECVWDSYGLSPLPLLLSPSKGWAGDHEEGGGFMEAITHSRKLGAAEGPALLAKCLPLPGARGEVGGGRLVPGD